MQDEKRSRDHWVAAAGMGFESDLARLMEVCGLSQAELADKIGKSPAYVSRVLNGSYGNYTVATMVNFARALGANVEVRLVVEGQETTRIVDLETAARLDRAREGNVGSHSSREARDVADVEQETIRRLKIA